MQPLPHHYRVTASGRAAGAVALATPGVPALDTHAPPEFGGPEGHWSPETLLVGSIADCYVLSFRAVARASKLEWLDLEVAASGVLDRSEGVTRFVSFTVAPQLTLQGDSQASLARTVLEKAKRACLITNSLNAPCELEPSVRCAEPAGG